MIEAAFVLIIIVAIGVMGGVNYFVVAKLTPKPETVERTYTISGNISNEVIELKQMVSVLQKQRAEMNEEMITIKNQFKTIVGIYENSQKDFASFREHEVKEVTDIKTVVTELGKNFKMITTKKL